MKTVPVNITHENDTVNNGVNLGSLEEIKPLRSKSGNFSYLHTFDLQ